MITPSGPRRPWIITTLAVLSVLYAIGPLFNAFPPLLWEPLPWLARLLATLWYEVTREFLRFSIPIVWDLVLLASGLALFSGKPWSRQGYFACALGSTVQLLSDFRFPMAYYIARGDVRASALMSLVLRHAVGWDLNSFLIKGRFIIGASNALATVVAWTAYFVVVRYGPRPPARTGPPWGGVRSLAASFCDGGWTRRLASARGMTAGAFLLWLVALPLPALVIDSYPHGSAIRGWYILLLGWFAFLEWNVAWLANFFFLTAVGILGMSAKPATKSAVAAALLALDTVRFNAVMVNENGTTVPVYGYGLGAICWLAAMCLILVAAGQRILETPPAATEGAPRADARRTGTTLRAVGIGALAVLLGGSAVLAPYDHWHVNSSERTQLASTVFKRARACQDKEPHAFSQIPLDGPLELRGDSLPPPFDTPRQLLAWGIPAVRLRGWDYFLADPQEPDLLAARPAMGWAGGRLDAVTRDPTILWAGALRTALTSSDGSLVLFDQWWWRTSRDGPTCPPYASAPTAQEQPRKLLMSVLILPGDAVRATKDREARRASGSTRYAVSQVVGRVGNRRDLPGGAGAIPRNVGCPRGVGYKELVAGQTAPSMFPGPAFQVHDQTFVTDKIPGTYERAVCTGQDVYLLASGPQTVGSAYVFDVQKRVLPGFRLAWSASIRVPASSGFVANAATQIGSITERDGMLALDLIQPAQQTHVEVQVPLNDVEGASGNR